MGAILGADRAQGTNVGKGLKACAVLAGIFAFFYFVPFDSAGGRAAIGEAFDMLQWHAREHTLAGPALSIPSILVLIRVMGGKKTLVSCTLVVIMSTVVGLVFGNL